MAINAVGLDVSLTATGAARIRIDDDGTVLGRPHFRHFGEGGTSHATTGESLARIRTQAGRILKFVKDGAEPGDVTVVLVEGVAFASTTAFAHLGGGLWWLAVNYLVHSAGAHIATANVSSVKSYASGNGSAKKPAMVAAVQRMYPDLAITDHNDADALALLGMLCRELGHPLEPSVQRVNPAALERVDWPDFVRAYRDARP